MKKIEGKQIKDGTIEQRSMKVLSDSITENNSVTNKEYVLEKVNQSLSGLYQAKLNLNMVTNNATVGELACEKSVIEFPLSPVMVKLNGILMSVGPDKDFYFSPDGGTTKREGGSALKGDKLYWNSSDYNLDEQDEIDLVYLVGYDYIEGSIGQVVDLHPIYNSIVVKFNGGLSETMFVVLNGSTIEVGNINGQFVWDVDGLDEHTFTEVGESLVVEIGGEEYTIWFDGFGSLIFSVRKGNWKIDSGSDYTKIKYGFLYNWWATQDQGGGVNIIPAAMASEGWSVPTDANFTTLTTYLGGESVAGGKLKETGFEYWNEPNTGATNELGFNAIPGGYRRNYGTFDYIGYDGHWWSATEYSTDYAWYRNLYYDYSDVHRGFSYKKMGFSVRLTRLATAAEQILPDGEIDATYTGNDGKVYRCTKIGTQVWIADNLAETKWSDGSWIAGYDGGTYTPITNANWAALTTAALCAYDNDPEQYM